MTKSSYSILNIEFNLRLAGLGWAGLGWSVHLTTLLESSAAASAGAWWRPEAA